MASAGAAAHREASRNVCLAHGGAALGIVGSDAFGSYKAAAALPAAFAGPLAPPDGNSAWQQTE